MPDHRQTRGFTLVELLVAIGVIVTLLAILLPAVNRAREQGRSVMCLSNLRTLGTAMTAYVQRDGRYPRPAVGAMREDWFHWRYDPAVPSVHSANGGIGAFLGTDGSNQSRVWKCPSDDPETHLIRSGSNAAYPYSYTVNFILCTYSALGLSNWPKDDANLPRTMSPLQVKRPEQTILIIDESAETIDDGCWAWQWVGGGGRNVLSNRHDRQKETATDWNAGYGNVCFADGHAERVPRIRTSDPQYYDPFLPGASLLPAPTVAVPPN